jgi:hypothetical protein
MDPELALSNNQTVRAIVTLGVLSLVSGPSPNTESNTNDLRGSLQNKIELTPEQ